MTNTFVQVTKDIYKDTLKKKSARQERRHSRIPYIWGQYDTPREPQITQNINRVRVRELSGNKYMSTNLYMALNPDDQYLFFLLCSQTERRTRKWHNYSRSRDRYNATMSDTLRNYRPHSHVDSAHSRVNWGWCRRDSTNLPPTTIALRTATRREKGATNRQRPLNLTTRPHQILVMEKRFWTWAW